MALRLGGASALRVLLRTASSTGTHAPQAAGTSRTVAAAAAGAGSSGLDAFLPDGFERVRRAGRAWEACELRLKSFDDLHKLWYVCLKERNALATERETARAVRKPMDDPTRIRKVRLTMNRIKQVLSERARLEANGDEEKLAQAMYVINAM